MTRKLGKDVKIARAVCRLKCGRGVKVGQVGEPKPQKGKAEVHVGSSSKGGGVYIPYNELSKEQKEEIMSSGIPNISKERTKNNRPTVGNVKKMGLKALDKLRDEGVWVRHDKKGKKTFKYQDGIPPSVLKMVDDEKKRRQDLKSTKTATKQVATQVKKADKKASKDDELKKKLMDKVNNGTERQKKASITQLNKKFGANLTYNKPEKKTKEPPKKVIKKFKIPKAKEPAKAPAKEKKPKAPAKAPAKAKSKASKEKTLKK